MPHQTFRILPGVDTNKTPTLNEAAISYTDLVRFMPDRTGMGLVQKLGGWTRYIAGGFSNAIRALKAWSDLEYTNYLAIGGEGTVGAQVYRQSDNSILDVTPHTLVDNLTTGVSYGITTTTNSASLTLYTPNVPSSASYVYFPTGINVGNVNLLGPYDIVTIGAGFLTFIVPEVLTPISKITAITAGSDRTVTVRFSAPHSFYAGEAIYVDGVDTASFNGSFVISSITTYTITYTQTGVSTAASSYGGVNSMIFAEAIDRTFKKEQYAR